MNGWLTASQLSAFAAAGTDAHRLYTSAPAWVERYGRDVLISYRSHDVLAGTLGALRGWADAVAFDLGRIYGRFIPRQNAERVAPEWLDGEPEGAPETVVREGGIAYGIDFAAGYSAGLFLDQRANRAYVRQRAGGGRLLNTFAYTCSFSVVGALAGMETLSLDLSKKSLDRGRENFVLNELDLKRHRFIADDVLNVLPRLERRGERFDVIILDPPTFSRGDKGRRWQVEEGFYDLIVQALALAGPGAWLLLSTNCTRLPAKALGRMARMALRQTRRAGQLFDAPLLPDFPPGEGAETMWLQLTNGG